MDKDTLGLFWWNYIMAILKMVHEKLTIQYLISISWDIQCHMHKIN